MIESYSKRFVQILQILRLLFVSILIEFIDWIKPRQWNAKNVDRDVVLVTGAGSGLGREIALQFAQLGSSLILWDINQDGLNETKALVKSKQSTMMNNSNHPKMCLTYNVDVSDRVKVQEFAIKVHEDLNRDKESSGQERYVSVLINNAGIYHGLLLHELRDDQIERIFKINILSHFWTVRAFLPHMIKHERGHIVEVASMGGIGGLTKQVDYCATKFATIGFEESLSIELNQRGLGEKIHTTAVCPFFFSSNLFSGLDTKHTAVMKAKFVASEAVWAMRCNRSRVLLPHFDSNLFALVKPLLNRSSLIEYNKSMGFFDGIRDIKGHAVSYNSKPC